MTERHVPRVESNPEHHHSAESKEHEKHLQEQLEKRAAEAPDKSEEAPELAKTAKEEALPAESIRVSETAPTEPSAQYVGRELKNLTFDRTLTRIRRKLSAPDKTLSKVVHQPVVKALSQAGEQTVARPSGVLGGSLCAFLGSSLFLWAAKHYGFRYNYFMFVIFFVGGFAVGLVIEMLVRLARRNKQTA